MSAQKRTQKVNRSWKIKPYISLKRVFLFLCFAFILFSFMIGLGTYWYLSDSLSKVLGLEAYHPPVVSTLWVQDGKKEVKLTEFFQERRYVVPYERIPKIAIQAFISAEDSHFFEHPGISWESILRAAIANLRAGAVVQGGSTITQQVAKSLFLTPEKRFIRKIKEAILAYRLEQHLSKEEILFLYLNQIYLGHGSYGIQAASKTYFHKDVSTLTLAEAAFLAGLPQAPSKYNPFMNPKKGKWRQRYVLKKMLENQFISQGDYETALQTPLKIYPILKKQKAPYLVEFIRQHLIQTYGKNKLYHEGLVIHLPTDIALIEKSEQSLQEGLRVLDKRIGFRTPIKHLDSEKEIQAFLERQTQHLKARVPYRLFLPDGSVSIEAAMEEMKKPKLQDWLNIGDRFLAVVQKTEDSQKEISVQAFNQIFKIPHKGWSWAPGVHRWERKQQFQKPSQFLKSGDVVWVQLKSKKPPMVFLDQEPELQGALLSFDVRHGHLLAMVGGYDFKKSQFNRTTQAFRQPGSAFKPIIFSFALTQGFTPASIIVDAPIVFRSKEIGKWKPKNFEQKFYGDTLLRRALIKSRNVPTIKIVRKIGIQNLLNYIQALGLKGTWPQDLSISLGSGSTTLWNLIKVYGLFPRLGRDWNPVMISKVEDRKGQVLFEAEPTPMPNEEALKSLLEYLKSENNPEDLNYFTHFPIEEDPLQKIDPRIAYLMAHLMTEVVHYGTGRRAHKLGDAVAGKTGTTNNYQDAWFLGFTPEVITGVWVGYDNQRSLGKLETGARAALPIWLEYMLEAVTHFPQSSFQIPPGVVFSAIDTRNGKLSQTRSKHTQIEAFVEGTEPKKQAPSDGGKRPETEEEFLKESIE